MWERPVDPVVEAVISHAAMPLLDKIQKELGRELITDVIVFREGVSGPRIRIGSDDVSNDADGELRLRIREAHGTNRFVYSMESVYKPNVSDVGFSGFVAKGEVRVPEEGIPKVKPKSWTVRYNVWTFAQD